MYSKETYLVKKVQCKMIRDRGYDPYFTSDYTKRLPHDPKDFRDIDAYGNAISDSRRIGSNVEEFSSCYPDYGKYIYSMILYLAQLTENESKKFTPDDNQILSNLYISRTTNEICLVYYTKQMKGKNVVTEHITHFLLLCERLKIRHAIFISETAIHSSCNKILQNDLPFFSIQTFQFDELLINPTKHFLVPRHFKKSKEFKEKFLADNDIKVNQLPIIRNTDPICKYYDFKIGDLIAIARIVPYEGAIVKVFVSYRIVKPLEKDFKKAPNKSKS